MPFEIPAAESGVNTLISAVPKDASSSEEMAAVSTVLLTKVVGREDPFH